MRDLIRLLGETRPWVRLFGVYMMIAAVAMIVVNLLKILGATGGATGSSIGIEGVVYLAASLLCVFPALFLSRYASAISQAEALGGMSQVVDAISQQKKFWRSCGILTAFCIVVYLLTLVFVFAMMAIR